jgi:hypothetical protein
MDKGSNTVSFREMVVRCHVSQLRSLALFRFHQESNTISCVFVRHNKASKPAESARLIHAISKRRPIALEQLKEYSKKGTIPNYSKILIQFVTRFF